LLVAFERKVLTTEMRAQCVGGGQECRLERTNVTDNPLLIKHKLKMSQNKTKEALYLSHVRGAIFVNNSPRAELSPPTNLVLTVQFLMCFK